MKQLSKKESWEEEVVDAGCVSLSMSGKSLTIRVVNETFFVPLRHLRKVLDGETRRADVKQWVKRDTRRKKISANSKRKEGEVRIT